jgi:ureidoglycolate hydrolase
MEEKQKWETPRLESIEVEKTAMEKFPLGNETFIPSYGNS